MNQIVVSIPAEHAEIEDLIAANKSLAMTVRSLKQKVAELEATLGVFADRGNWDDYRKAPGEWNQLRGEILWKGDEEEPWKFAASHLACR